MNKTLGILATVSLVILLSGIQGNKAQAWGWGPHGDGGYGGGSCAEMDHPYPGCNHGYGDNSYNGGGFLNTIAQDLTGNNGDNNGFTAPSYNQPSYNPVGDNQYGYVAKNGFSCNGEWRCVSGWNQAIVVAQNDYHSGYQQAQDQCPGGHTDSFCTGWTQGYDDQWNSQVNSQSSAQAQQCNIINSPGGTCNQEQSSNQNQSP